MLSIQKALSSIFSIEKKRKRKCSIFFLLIDRVTGFFILFYETMYGSLFAGLPFIIFPWLCKIQIREFFQHCSSI